MKGTAIIAVAVWVLSLGLLSFAGEISPVSEDEALTVARNWVQLGQEVEWGWSGAPLLSASAVEPFALGGERLAYCFNIPSGGYVIVPACRELPPITAYSFESSLDLEADDGFAEMIREVLVYKTDLVRDYLSRAAPPDEWLPIGEEIENNRNLWSDYGSPYEEFTAALAETTRKLNGLPPGEAGPRYDIRALGPLLQTSWKQGDPYNIFCPMGYGGRCVVGCVATAAAQIMAYWRQPAAGTGSHSYWWDGDQSCSGGSTAGQTLSATFSDAYDWANILNRYTGGETAAQKNAVAELCYEVGVALEMDYGKCGSGAYTADVATVLPTYFGYSSAADKEDRSAYASGSAWFNMLKEDLNNNRPLQYRISGHSIVCDGWQVAGTNQIHLNYGWDDNHNTWYTVDNLYCPWSGCSYLVEFAIRRIYPASAPPPPSTARAPLQLFAGDFTGNAYSDIGIFRNGLWAIRGVTRAYFGQSGDIPITADFNGDGRADIAVFRPSSGLWSVRRVTRFYYGRTGDYPIPMNYKPGFAMAGIYRPSNGLWSFRGGGSMYFGKSGDIPVPGPWVDRSEKWGQVWCGIFRPSTGLWATEDGKRFYFGRSGDTPVPGAYTTSSTEPWKAAIFRPSSGLWSVRGVTRAYFGGSADTPVPADYAGAWGDEMAIFRPSTGLWAIRGGGRYYYGGSADIPVTR